MTQSSDSSDRDVGKFVDELCDEFERGWQNGQPDRIEAIVKSAPESIRPVLFRDLLSLEREYRIRSGQSLTVTEVLDRFSFLGQWTVQIVHDVFDQTLDQVRTVQSVGKYLLLEVLGEGGMGIVYRASDPDLDRQVAIKLMHPNRAIDSSARQRFIREVRAAAAIRHDHVVPIYHIGEHIGRLYFVMPALEGESLDRRLIRETRLPPDLVRKIGREVALGLAVAHAKGIVHRDVKPANIWLEVNGNRVDRAIVLDFGLARSADESDRLTSEFVAVGTVGYISPEQASDKVVDSRTDLFSLGCVLYRALTGRLPYPGKTLQSVALAMATTVPPAPREVDPTIPVDLSDLVVALLEWEPTNRPADALVVAEALRLQPDSVEPIADTDDRGTRDAIPALVANLTDIQALWTEFAGFVPKSIRPVHERSLAAVTARLAEPKFRVAVVGRGRQGKTTLINRLLGVDVVPLNASSWVAARVAVSWSIRPTARFNIRPGANWPDGGKPSSSGSNTTSREIPLDRVADYLSAIDEMDEPWAERFEIGTPSDFLLPGLELLDTTGFDRSAQTDVWRDALDAADQVILVADETVLPSDMTFANRELRPRGHESFVAVVMSTGREDNLTESARIVTASRFKLPSEAVFFVGGTKSPPNLELDRLAARLRRDATDRHRLKALTALLHLRTAASSLFGHRPSGEQAALLKRIREQIEMTANNERTP